MLQARLIDPLSGQADPRLYVPVDSAESALGAIAMALKVGCSPVVLAGPSGIGKTLLLRVLAERERQWFARVRLSARLTHAPDDLAAGLVHLLFGGVPPRRADAAELALVRELRAQRDSRTLLLIDDIHCASDASIDKLAELARATKPALSLVVAGTSGTRLPLLSATLSAGFCVVLPESLPEREIEALYDAILAQPGLSPRLRHRLESVDRAEITRIAAGVPRLLIDELARRNQDRLEATPQRLTPLPQSLDAPTAPSESQGLIPILFSPRSSRRGAMPRLALQSARAALGAALALLVTEAVSEAVRYAALLAATAALAAKRGTRSRLASSAGSVTRLRGAFAASLHRARIALHGACSGIARSCTRSVSQWAAGARARLAGATLAARASRATAQAAVARLGGRIVSRLASSLAGARRAAGVARDGGRAGVSRAGHAMGAVLRLPGTAAAASLRASESFLASSGARVTRAQSAFRAAQSALARSLTRRIGDSTARLRASVVGARLALRTSLESAYTRVTQLGRAVVSRGAALPAAAQQAAKRTRERGRTGMIRARDTIRVAQLAAGRVARGGSAALERAVTEAVEGGKRVGAMSQGKVLAVSRLTLGAADRGRSRLSGTGARARRPGTTWVVGARAYATSAGSRIHIRAREATQRGRLALGRAGRSALRAARAPAIPAALIALIVVGALSALREQWVERSTLASAALQQTEVAAVTHTGLPSSSAPLNGEVNVQVNARPWARVWINGRDLGPTPLRHSLPPGLYQLEAKFPDGQRIQRSIDVGPEGRFVSLP